MREFLFVLYKEDDTKQEPKKETFHIPFVNDEVDLIEKKRALKRWKTTFSYYSLNPKKFNFGIKNLK
jgi:hypothetical protein